MSLHAWSDYVRASESAGVTVRNLRPHECVTAADILTELWGGTPMGAPLLVAMEHAGTYVAGAFRADELVGRVRGLLWAAGGEGDALSCRGSQGRERRDRRWHGDEDAPTRVVPRP